MARIAIYCGKKARSGFIVEKLEFRDLSREKANFAIFRGKSNISRYRDDRD